MSLILPNAIATLYSTPSTKSFDGLIISFDASILSFPSFEDTSKLSNKALSETRLIVIAPWPKSIFSSNWTIILLLLATLIAPSIGKKELTLGGVVSITKSVVKL